jgi:WG containing repeat
MIGKPRRNPGFLLCRGLNEDVLRTNCHCRAYINRCVCSPGHREQLARQHSITSRYVRELPFDRFGLAPVYSHKYGWMYANRTGIVVVSGVYGFDNWADEFHGGLVRVTRKGKFGFANRKGAIVIAAVYDGAFSFKNGSAIVCRQCRCERSGKHCVLRSGEWFRIDVSGKTLERLPQQH